MDYTGSSNLRPTSGSNPKPPDINPAMSLQAPTKILPGPGKLQPAGYSLGLEVSELLRDREEP